MDSSRWWLLKDYQEQLVQLYAGIIKELKPKQQKLLFTILLLDTDASEKRIIEVSKLTSVTRDLSELKKNRLIMEHNGKFYIKKITILKKNFENLPDKEQKEYSDVILNSVELEFKKDICIMLGNASTNCFEESISSFSKLNDYQSLKKVYKLYN